jgi:hypothetical protein
LPVILQPRPLEAEMRMLVVYLSLLLVIMPYSLATSAWAERPPMHGVAR